MECCKLGILSIGDIFVTLFLSQIRSEFDDLLLTYASKSGVSVFQETKVTEIHFEGPDNIRPVKASWLAQNGAQGQIHFDYLVDASGRNGLMSIKYLKNRAFNQSLKNTACWGYWSGTDLYKPGTTRENAVWIEALTGKWFTIFCVRRLMTSI